MTQEQYSLLAIPPASGCYSYSWTNNLNNIHYVVRDSVSMYVHIGARPYLSGGRGYNTMFCIHIIHKIVHGHSAIPYPVKRSRHVFRCGQGVKGKNLLGQNLDPGRGWKYSRLCSVPPLELAK